MSYGGADVAAGEWVTPVGGPPPSRAGVIGAATGRKTAGETGGRTREPQATGPASTLLAQCLNQLQVLHHPSQLVEVLLRHRAKGQTQLCRGLAHQRDGMLDRDRIRFQEKGLEERIELVMDVAGLGRIAGRPGVQQRRHLGRRHVGGHRDDALRAHSQHRQGQRIIPRDAREPVPAELDDLAHLLERPRSFLDAHDVPDLGQPRHRLRGHIHGGAPGDVIEDLRDVHRFGHGLVVPVETLLGRFVVVPRDQQGRVRPDGLGMAGKLDRLVRRVGPRAGNDRHTPPDGLYGELNDPLVLRMGKRGGLARRPARHNTVGAARELPFDQIAEGLLVYSAVAKRRDDGDQRSGEAHCSVYSQAFAGMEPSHTIRASPVRVMVVNRGPSTWNDTVRGLRLKGTTVTGDSTLWTTAAINGAGMAPLPHASVSSSTPRSYVRMRIVCRSTTSTKFTLVPDGLKAA